MRQYTRSLVAMGDYSLGVTIPANELPDDAECGDDVVIDPDGDGIVRIVSIEKREHSADRARGAAD